MVPGQIGPHGRHVTPHVEEEKRHVQGPVTILARQMTGPIARARTSRSRNALMSHVPVKLVILLVLFARAKRIK